MKRSLAVLSVLGFVAAGCGGGTEEAPDTTAATTETPVRTETDAEAEAAEEPPPVKLEGNVNVHAQTEVSGDTLTMEADDFYFEPTFVKAEEGATVTVELTNEGAAPHTFTIEEQGIDVRIDPGESATAEVTVDATLNFICRFHVSQGMQGAFYTDGSASTTGTSSGEDDDSSGGGYYDDYDY